MIETGLAGKVVVVTGAAGGIGRATALRFAAEGCRVAGWDVKEENGLVGELQSAGAEGFFDHVNVAESAEVESAAQRLLDKWGPAYVLVNNAGILRDGQLVKYKDGSLLGTMSDQQFDSVIGVNLRGVFVCTRAFAPQMIAAGSGVILNASSVVGLYGNFGQTNYVATKSGVIGMTKVWARELGKYGIRVNAVAPGFIATEMVQAMPEKILAAMRERTPLQRVGTVDDIANAYLWLASSAASFVTGTCLSVDGGVVTGT